MDLLQSLTSTIPIARRNAIRRLVDEAIARGDVQTAEEALSELDKLVAAVTTSKIKSITKIRKAVSGEKISSQDWNDIQGEVFVDLHAVYKETQAIETLSATHSVVGQSSLNESKAAINKAITDIRAFQELKKNPEYQDVKFISFDSGRNLSTRRPVAEVDIRTRTLSLSPKQTLRLQQGNLDLNSTKVIYRSLGGGVTGGLDESFSPQLMLDDNPDTFWGEITLTDSIVQQIYVPSSDSGRGVSFTSNGILCEVEVQMSSSQSINNIALLPFGPYPISIVDMAYKESPHAKSWITIPEFTIPDPTLDWNVWSFTPVHMSTLRVTLEQINYTANIYHLPERLVNNQILWSQILNKQLDRTLHQVEIDEVLSAKIAAEPEQLAYLNAVDLVSDELRYVAMSTRRNTDHYDVVTKLLSAAGIVLAKIQPSELDKVLTPISGEQPDSDEEKIIEIKKLEYAYGIRSLEMNKIRYNPLAHYASPQFASNATVLEVELHTDEEHPTFNDGISDYHKTSIEYELEIGENVRLPILPANVDKITGLTKSVYKVKDEYLAMDRNTKKVLTRFKPASVAVIVRKNGIRISFDDYTFSIDATTSRGLLTVTNNFDANAVYTVSYNAIQESALIDINTLYDSTALVTADKFTGTNRDNSLKLSYFPYIEYNIVNDSTSWIRDDDEDAKWRLTPTQSNYKIGTVEVTNGSTTVTGTGTSWLTNNAFDLSAGITNVIRVKGDTKTYTISSVPTETGIVLTTPYTGATVSGADYQAGQAFTADGVEYALDSMVYEPIKVFVNDVKAFNLTNYRSLEHPAFIPSDSISRQYQFIHAGSILYFNTPIANATIEVFYNWLTQYLQIKSIFRCNIPIRTDITPKVDSYTVRIKNSRL